jgi:hypothetical protein
MLARDSHNMILFNSLNKFSFNPTLIQYPLYTHGSDEFPMATLKSG